MHLFSPRHSSNKFGSALGYRKRSVLIIYLSVNILSGKNFDGLSYYATLAFRAGNTSF